MITLDDIRGYAMALPEVEEATHFNLPSFKVRGRGFVVIEKGDTHAIVSVDEAETKAAVADDPDAFEEVWRSGRIFVGLRVDLTKASAGRTRGLVEHAWRNKAPKRLVAAYEKNR